MLVIRMGCEACDGTLEFTVAGRHRGGRLIGTCEGCGGVYALDGGRLLPIDVPPEGRARWTGPGDAR